MCVCVCVCVCVPTGHQELESIGKAREREYARVAGIKQERLVVADRVIAREAAIIAECNAVSA